MEERVLNNQAKLFELHDSKPYKCEICGKGFRTVKARNGHMPSHYREKIPKEQVKNQNPMNGHNPSSYPTENKSANEAKLEAENKHLKDKLQELQQSHSQALGEVETKVNDRLSQELLKRDFDREKEEKERLRDENKELKDENKELKNRLEEYEKQSSFEEKLQGYLPAVVNGLAQNYPKQANQLMGLMGLGDPEETKQLGGQTLSDEDKKNLEFGQRLAENFTEDQFHLIIQILHNLSQNKQLITKTNQLIMHMMQQDQHNNFENENMNTNDGDNNFES